MRLLKLQDDGEFSLVEFEGRKIPPYAILSHTWGKNHDEVTLKDLIEGIGKNKASYPKLTFCAKQAAEDGLQYCWVDTCCIDKSNDQELSEAIRSMFRWYQNAHICYVYLSDVSVREWESAFERSRWFKRGWTLQELIAPKVVEFFSAEEELLGDKKSLGQTIQKITGIPMGVLQGSPLSEIDVDERLSWATGRETKREEDEVYSLLGLFSVHMSILYGEGRESALHRLQQRICGPSNHEQPTPHRFAEAKETSPNQAGSLAGMSIIYGSASGHNALHGNYQGNTFNFLTSKDKTAKRRCEDEPTENSKRARAMDIPTGNHGTWKYSKGDSYEQDSDEDDDGGTSLEDSDGCSSANVEGDSLQDSSDDNSEDSSGGSSGDNEPASQSEDEEL